jgi:hypothetical protein
MKIDDERETDCGSVCERQKVGAARRAALILFLHDALLVVKDGDVKVVEVGHGLGCINEERKGVLALLEFDGDVSRHHTSVGGGSVGKDFRVPYLLAVETNPDPDHHVGGLAPDRPADFQKHRRVSGGLKGGIDGQGAYFLDDYLYSHAYLLFALGY